MMGKVTEFPGPSSGLDIPIIEVEPMIKNGYILLGTIMAFAVNE